MNITVLIKIVSNSQFADLICDEPKERLMSGFLTINPADEFALEQALRIRDRKPDTRITVITMAPARAEPVLRHALAMGADDAVHVHDSCFAGSDSLITARILSAAISKLPPQDLVICGQRAIDSETGHIPPQLAALLEIPVITNVLSILEEEEDHIKVVRLQDDGQVEITCPRGVVLSMCCGTEMIRIPKIKDVQNARKKTILHLDRKQLAVGENEAGIAGSPTRVIQVTQICYPNRHGQGTDDLSEGASVILNTIRKYENYE